MGRGALEEVVTRFGQPGEKMAHQTAFHGAKGTSRPHASRLRKERAPQANKARPRNVAARIRMRTPQEAALTAVASRPIFKSAHLSTATARLNVSTRPWSGMLARIAAGLLTAAS